MGGSKILITGSNGVVGSYIPSVFTQSTLFMTTRTTMDVTNRDEVLKMANHIKPTIIIHLAANTDVDECQKNSAAAYEVNYIGTKNIAEAARLVRAIVIYVSTCAIFDGEKKFYIESDKPNPINIYGKTKLLAEQTLINTLKKYYIIRSGWIIGGGQKEKKFISYVVKQLHDGKKEILAVEDKYGSLTYAKELILFMKELIQNKPYGVYHFSSSGACSRFDMGRVIVQMLDVNVTVKPVKSAYFQKKFFAPRPKYEVVKSIKKQYTKTWQETLKEYIRSEIQPA